jgi:hypothetical protein
MAQQKPIFVTGANAKIQVDSKTFAYASDVSYNVSVDTIPVETMGRYEAIANEPVNYSVSGELSVVRYTKLAGGANMPGTNAQGNGLGNAAGSTNGKRSDEFNPGSMLLSQTWDLAVYQKTEATAGAIDSTQQFIKIIDCRFRNKTSGLNKRGLWVERLSFVGRLHQDDSFEVTNSGDIDFT